MAARSRSYSSDMLLDESEITEFLRFKIRHTDHLAPHRAHLETLLERGDVEAVLTALRAKPTVDGWACHSCTFINPPTAERCEMCSAPRMAVQFHPPPPVLNWECARCTYLNAMANESCEMCQFGRGAEELEKMPSTPLARSDSLLPAAAEDVRRQFGAWATPGKDGVSFRVWAPNAHCVCIAGAFNRWRRDEVLAREGDGCWGGHVVGAHVGDEYKLYIQTRDGQWLWRNDPCGRYLAAGGTRNDVICDRMPVVDGFVCPPLHQMVVYEMHVHTFSPAGTWAGAMARLPYLRDLGVNALCVLPPTQDSHAVCWGYDPISLYAVHRQYGTPDDLKRFITAAHVHGIACIIDWVPNHMAGDSILRNFDSLSGGSFFYASADLRCTPFGPRLDYSNPMVREWLLNSARMWLGEYNFDGLRVDSTRTLRRTDTDLQSTTRTDLPESWIFMQALNDMVHAEFPGKITIAEDLDGSARLNDTAGFDSQWDEHFFIALYRAVVTPSDTARDVGAVAHHIARLFTGRCGDRIIYTENHDTIPGDRSLRMPEAIERGDGAYGVMRSLLAAAILLTSPGTPMLLMGQETLERRCPVWPTPPQIDVDVHDELRNAVTLKYAQLIRLRRNMDGDTAGLCGVGVRITHVHHKLKVLAYHRFHRGGAGDDVVVVVNMANQDHAQYRIGLPRAGPWRVCFHTGTAPTGVPSKPFPAHEVHGCDAVSHAYDDFPFSGTLALAPYCAVVLAQQRVPSA